MKVSGGGSPQPATKAPVMGASPCLPLCQTVGGWVGWEGDHPSLFPPFCVLPPGWGGVRACDADVFAHSPSLGRQLWPWCVYVCVCVGGDWLASALARSPFCH